MLFLIACAGFVLRDVTLHFACENSLCKLTIGRPGCKHLREATMALPASHISNPALLKDARTRPTDPVSAA